MEENVVPGDGKAAGDVGVIARVMTAQHDAGLRVEGGSDSGNHRDRNCDEGYQQERHEATARMGRTAMIGARLLDP